MLEASFAISGAIAAGLLLAGDPQASLGYVDKALGVAQQHPDIGFPYPAQSTRFSRSWQSIGPTRRNSSWTWL